MSETDHHGESTISFLCSVAMPVLPDAMYICMLYEYSKNIVKYGKNSLPDGPKKNKQQLFSPCVPGPCCSLHSFGHLGQGLVGIRDGFEDSVIAAWEVFVHTIDKQWNRIMTII